MSEKINLPAIFSKKSKSRLIKDNGITLTLNDDHLIARTSYSYEGLVNEDDELSGYVDKRVNEKSIIKKDRISQIACGYESDTDVYFLGTIGDGFNSYINVESAEKGNEVLNQLIDWWL